MSQKRKSLNPKAHKSQGVGDTVSKIISKATRGKIKECGGCKKRKEWLNKVLPYGPKDTSSKEIESDCKSCQEKLKLAQIKERQKKMREKREKLNARFDPSKFSLD